MPLGTIEYMELLNAFGEDVQEINDSLYKATKPATPDGKRDAALKTGRKKLKDYGALLSKLDGAQRKNAEKRFGEWMEEMEGYVTQLEKAS